MPPASPLPISDEFKDADEYVDSLLSFVSTSSLFQTLCGGVHILDFLTRDPTLFHVVLPKEWRSWLKECEEMRFLDLLMRDDLELLSGLPELEKPPQSLLDYIQEVRKHCLQRSYKPVSNPLPKIPRQVAVGMIPKKIHEVTNFAGFVEEVAHEIAIQSGEEITHFVDFGSGQNYLGRTLASPPYNKHIIAVESKTPNIQGAQKMDVAAGVAERETVFRNKKLFREQLQNLSLSGKPIAEFQSTSTVESASNADMRPISDLNIIYKAEEGRGSIKYIEHVVQDGDLSDVVCQLDPLPQSENRSSDSPPENSGSTGNSRLMALSIHSCGNLSHHGIRSLLLNPTMHAVAIVGCCYNLLTERLGPPSYKLPALQSYELPLNARRVRSSSAHDPHGFPMSERFSTYGQGGIRMNITARMMAVQAPQNWTVKETDNFFTRHFFRALLQRIFLDRGVVSQPYATTNTEQGQEGLLASATEPLIIGSLRKSCYQSFTAYVRGAVNKLSADPDRGEMIVEKMAGMTDDDIEQYAQIYGSMKKELSMIWSLMAFSAGVVESLITVDRWLFLKEHPDIVDKAWVQTVFDYAQSPRNLVVVGIKK